MLQYSVIHSLLTRHGIAVCALLLLVCQLGCDNNHNTRFQQKAYKPWSPHCMLFGEAVLIFLSQIAWVISHYLKLCFPAMTPTGEDSLQHQDYFVQFGTGRFCCRSLSNMKWCKVSGLESKLFLNADSPDPASDLSRQRMAETWAGSPVWSKKSLLLMWHERICIYHKF